MANSNRTEEDNNLIPLMVLVVCVVIGGYAVTEASTFADAPYVLVALLLVSVGGVGYVAWGFNDVRRKSGMHAAVGWLVSDLGDSSTSSGGPDVDKTPPTPEKLKNTIRVERAHGRCEFCDEESDFLEVHHIKPRADGGPNTRMNLIALCPTCHKKADRGVHSRSKLKHVVRNTEA